MKIEKENLCLALDINNEKEILDCVKELSDLIGYFKVNYSFTKFGPSLIKKIKKYNTKIFLDLKLHDIPNTISGYAENLVELGVDIVTIHTSGGSEMMKKMVESTKRIAKEHNVEPPLIIGVTVLTSINNISLENELNIQASMIEEVKRKSLLALECGLDGIVCSPNELEELTKILPKDFYFVTPGIRSTGISHNDHKRVTSPEEAINMGSKLLVVGREVLNSSDKRKSIQRILGN